MVKRALSAMQVSDAHSESAITVSLHSATAGTTPEHVNSTGCSSETQNLTFTDLLQDGMYTTPCFSLSSLPCLLEMFINDRCMLSCLFWLLSILTSVVAVLVQHSTLFSSWSVVVPLINSEGVQRHLTECIECLNC